MRRTRPSTPRATRPTSPATTSRSTSWYVRARVRACGRAAASQGGGRAGRATLPGMLLKGRRGLAYQRGHSHRRRGVSHIRCASLLPPPPSGTEGVSAGLIIHELNYLEIYTYERWFAKTIPVSGGSSRRVRARSRRPCQPYEVGTTFYPTSLRMEEGMTQPPPVSPAWCPPARHRCLTLVRVRASAASDGDGPHLHDGTEPDRVRAGQSLPPARSLTRARSTDATVAQHIQTIQERVSARLT
jgi:hypothetical protein